MVERLLNKRFACLDVFLGPCGFDCAQMGLLLEREQVEGHVSERMRGLKERGGALGTQEGEDINE